MLGKRSMHKVCVYAREHNGSRHALVKVANDRNEHRRLRQTADVTHLRQVLMMQVQAVNALRIVPRIAVLVLILRDHLLAAAGVTGQ